MKLSEIPTIKEEGEVADLPEGSIIRIPDGSVCKVFFNDEEAKNNLILLSNGTKGKAQYIQKMPKKRKDWSHRDGRAFLKIKIKSMSAEQRITHMEERKTPSLSRYLELYNHRMKLRVLLRAAFVAYDIIRGRPVSDTKASFSIDGPQIFTESVFGVTRRTVPPWNSFS